MPSDSAFPDSNVPPRVYVPPQWQIDPEKEGRIGVLCGPAVWTFTAKRPAGIPAPEGAIPFDGSLLDLLNLARVSKLAAVWLVPVGESVGRSDARLLREWGGNPYRRDSKLIHKSYSVHELTARGGLGGSAALAGVVARSLDGTTKSQTGGVIRILAPWVQDGWRLSSALSTLSPDPQTRAAQFAGSILRASFALGAQLRFSPSHTGLTMLRQELDRWQRRGIDLSLSETWRAFFHERRAVPLQWIRPGGKAGAEPRGHAGPLLTLWKYDRNGSYVASAREVPTGEPIALPGPRLVAAGERVPMGLYRVRAVPPAWFDPRELPGPFREGDQWTGAPESAWVWEPQLRLAQRHGWEIELREGWYWPRGQVHDLFRAWQDRIFRARQETAGDRIANGIVKQVGVASIGRLIPTRGRVVMTEAEASSKKLPPLWRFRDDAGKATGMVEVEADAGRVDLVRPDWWSIVISNAVERLLEQAYSKARSTTVLLYVDALYSLEPIPALAGDPRKRGGFKQEGVRQVPAELATSGDPIALVRAFARGEEAAPDGA